MALIKSGGLIRYRDRQPAEPRCRPWTCASAQRLSTEMHWPGPLIWPGGWMRLDAVGCSAPSRRS